VFALLPLQFRYALEARPYAMALAVSAWTITMFDQILEKPTGVRLVSYGLLAVGGLYLQPYSVFILAAQGLWILVRRRDILIPVLAVQASAIAAFLPWVLYAGAWATPLSIVEGDQATGWKSMGLIAHEITGMGYPGTILIVLGISGGLQGFARRSLWFLYLAVPILGALTLDLAFGYFLAIRQMIYAIIPMAILFAYGVEQFALENRKWAAALLAGLLAGSLFVDVTMFFRPRENWKAAAVELQEAAGQGACLVFTPASSEVYYTFFSPALSGSKCPPGSLPRAHRIAVAISPAAQDADLADLEAQGLFKIHWEHGPPHPPYVREFSTR
jgi:hypothetical protein